MLTKVCAAVIIINSSGLSWTKIDQKALNRATLVCKYEYNLCLKKFIKKDFQKYNAICGESK